MKKSFLMVCFFCTVLVALQGIVYGSSLKTLGGNGPLEAQVGLSPSEVNAGSHAIRNGFKGDYYVLSYQVPDAVFRVNPYGIIDRVTGLSETTDDFIVDYDASIIFANWWSTVEKSNPDGTVTRIAGNGIQGCPVDGALATQTQLTNPEAVAIDASGNVYVADRGCDAIYKINKATGTINFFASAATAQKMVAIPTGDLLVSFYGENCVRRYDKNGASIVIAGICGYGEQGVTTEGVPATSISLIRINGLDADKWGNIYFAETWNHCIRKVDSKGIITTVAGQCTVAGDSDNLTNAKLGSMTYPRGLSVDNDGNIFISGYGWIKKVTFTPEVASVLTPDGTDSGSMGEKIVIKGKYFGSNQGTSTANINGITMVVTHWSNTEIHAIIPNMPVGNYIVSVTAEGGTSTDVVRFRVK